MFLDHPRRGLYLSPITGAIGTQFATSTVGIATLWGLNFRVTISTVSILPAGTSLTVILESSPNGSSGWVVNTTKAITTTTTVTDIPIVNPDGVTWYRAYLSVTPDFRGPYTTPVTVGGRILVASYQGSGVTGSFVVPARSAVMQAPFLVAGGGHGASVGSISSTKTGGGGGGGSAIMHGAMITVTPGQTFFYSLGGPGAQSYIRRDGNGNTANQMLAFGGQSASGSTHGNGGAAPQATGIFIGSNTTSVGGVAADGQDVTTPGEIGYGGTGGHAGSEVVGYVPAAGAPTHGDPGIGDTPAPPPTIYGHGGGGGGIVYLNTVGVGAVGKPGYFEAFIYTA